MGDQTANLPVGTVFDDRYEVVRRIGKGGVGVVYEVIHLETRRHRALKVMRAGKLDHESLRKRFEQEATVVAGVDSEHIADVIDAGVHQQSGAPFIVMELLKGEELGKMLTRRGRLPPREVVLLLAQAAVALDKTHAAGILHRDLKPENLFVSFRDDGRPCVKVLDFGIAKALATDSDVRTTRGILGTPYYLAPEQVHGLKRQSSRTDGYALAQIAYTLLTGAPYWKHDPSAEENQYGRLIAVSQGASEPARARAGKHSEVVLPEAFDPWFTKATAVQPADRYDSCAELITALAGALDVPAPAILLQSPAVLPAPDSEPDLAPRPAARRARWIWLGAIILMAAMVTTIALLRSAPPPADPQATPPSRAASAPADPSPRPSVAEALSSNAAAATSSSSSSSSPSSAPAAAGPPTPRPVPKPTSTATQGWTPPVTER